jgi:hypothetical protein
MICTSAGRDHQLALSAIHGIIHSGEKSSLWRNEMDTIIGSLAYILAAGKSDPWTAVMRTETDVKEATEKYHSMHQPAAALIVTILKLMCFEETSENGNL